MNDHYGKSDPNINPGQPHFKGPEHTPPPSRDGSLYPTSANPAIETTCWGDVKFQTSIAEGIVYVTTATHGGYVLSDVRANWLNEHMPGLKPFLGSYTYWEKEYDAPVILAAFPEFFVNNFDMIGAARAYLSRYAPDRLNIINKGFDTIRRDSETQRGGTEYLPPGSKVGDTIIIEVTDGIADVTFNPRDVPYKIIDHDVLDAEEEIAAERDELAETVENLLRDREVYSETVQRLGAERTDKINNLIQINNNHRQTLAGIRIMPDDAGPRMKVWAAEALSGYTQPVEATLLNALDECNRLRKWVDDLQSGMFINCAYCGHNYGPKDDTPATMADTLKQHIELCPKHPISSLKKERDKLLGVVETMCRDNVSMLTSLRKLASPDFITIIARMKYAQAAVDEAVGNTPTDGDDHEQHNQTE